MSDGAPSSQPAVDSTSILRMAASADSISLTLRLDAASVILMPCSVQVRRYHHQDHGAVYPSHSSPRQRPYCLHSYCTGVHGQGWYGEKQYQVLDSGIGGVTEEYLDPDSLTQADAFALDLLPDRARCFFSLLLLPLHLELLLDGL